MHVNRIATPDKSYLQGTVFVQKNVGRLQVSVNNGEGVNVFHSGEHLVEKGLNMLGGEILGR